MQKSLVWGTVLRGYRWHVGALGTKRCNHGRTLVRTHEPRSAPLHLSSSDFLHKHKKKLVYKHDGSGKQTGLGRVRHLLRVKDRLH